MTLFSGQVVQNAPEGMSRRLVLSVDEPIAPEPGQFLQVAAGVGTTYLRRPLSVADWDGTRGLLELLVLPVGPGTASIGASGPGSLLDCLGPLGRGFPLEGLGDVPLLIGGGIGAAPLVYLARRLATSGTPPVTFIGASEEDRIAGERSLYPFSRRLVVCTEDGSRGERGMVTEVMARKRDDLEGVTSILACGPRGMLAAVRDLAADLGVPAFGSLEEYMACGVGACLGCAVPMARPDNGKRYLRVCADGPVFPLEEVVLS